MENEDPYDLMMRGALPADLRFLVEAYPRETWRSHDNIVGMAQFWLERHQMFRDLGPIMKAGISDYREGKLDPMQFAQWFAPRLNFFLGELDGHHNVEDFHYFPAFARAEPRLKHGFEILDRDHHQIHEALVANAEAANAFLQGLQGDRDAALKAADAYGAANDRLLAMLLRHLDDEEDLIIPLMLDRGDGGFG